MDKTGKRFVNTICLLFSLNSCDVGCGGIQSESVSDTESGNAEETYRLMKVKNIWLLSRNRDILVKETS